MQTRVTVSATGRIDIDLALYGGPISRTDFRIINPDTAEALGVRLIVAAAQSRAIHSIKQEAAA